MSDKPKFSYAACRLAYSDLWGPLEQCAERHTVAGSLRRGKAEAGDIEILYIPKLVAVQKDLISTEEISRVDDMLEHLIKLGVLAKRKNVHGSEVWGEKNKLALHVKTKVPIDFFRATKDNWFNLLVCRTGSAESNIAIASAAKARGFRWNPYGPGFTRLSDGEIIPVRSEEEVFAIAGLPYKHPHER